MIFKALIDTGTSWIQVPRDDFLSLLNILNTNFIQNCREENS